MQNFSKGNIFKFGIEWTGWLKKCAFSTDNWPYIANGEK